MFARLAILFVIVPIVELVLLIWLGDLISFWPTVGIIVVTGILGAWLAKWQGRAVLRAIQQRLQRGEIPSDSLIDGMLVLVAGALMVTPGLITDTTGFLLLVPPFRRLLRRRIKKWFKGKIRSGDVHVAGSWRTGSGWMDDEDVIDVTPEPDSYNGADGSKQPVSLH